MKFIKMQGLGNDYVYVDTFAQQVQEPEKLAVRISRPHYGVGADGLILIGPSDRADARMRIFNADGSEAEMCGNGPALHRPVSIRIRPRAAHGHDH